MCYVCGNTHVHAHHCIPGTANRKKSEKYGLKIYLCPYHHNMSDEGVHFNRNFDMSVRKLAQSKFEEHYGTREDFIREFGRNYL